MSIYRAAVGHLHGTGRGDPGLRKVTTTPSPDNGPECGTTLGPVVDKRLRPRLDHLIRDQARELSRRTTASATGDPGLDQTQARSRMHTMARQFSCRNRQAPIATHDDLERIRGPGNGAHGDPTLPIHRRGRHDSTTGRMPARSAHGGDEQTELRTQEATSLVAPAKRKPLTCEN